MYSKCNCHLLETLCTFSRISKVSDGLNNVDTKFNFFVKVYISVRSINPNSSTEKQIKHFFYNFSLLYILVPKS